MKHVDPLDTAAATPIPFGFGHEAEHPQLDIPFSALAGGHVLDGVSLSLTRALVRGSLPEALLETVVDLALRVNFDGFSVVLFLDARVERTGPSEDKTHVLQFTDPTASHLAPLRYLLNSYIAGDVVSVGGVMGYTGPLSVKAKVEVTAPSALTRAKNVFRRFSVLALSAGLALLALNLAYERAFFAYESQPVKITAPGQTLLATSAGQMSYVDDQAGLGEVVYSIIANSGDYISVKMPCDCQVSPLRDFVEGATVLPGTPLVHLASGEEGLVATSEISPDGAARLVDGDSAELVLTDGTAVPVSLQILPGRHEANRSVPVEMTLLEVSDAAPGDLARLRFRRHLLPLSVRRVLGLGPVAEAGAP